MKPAKFERIAERAIVIMMVMILLAQIAGVDFGAWLRMMA